MDEYEALFQGLKKAIDLKVKFLRVFGDSNIIATHVRNTIHCMSPHLKSYQYEVWNLINSFDAFNITTIPRSQNVVANALVNAASRFTPLNNVEILFRPSILDNIKN
jgi:ribonuclease HI